MSGLTTGAHRDLRRRRSSANAKMKMPVAHALSNLTQTQAHFLAGEVGGALLAIKGA